MYSIPLSCACTVVADGDDEAVIGIAVGVASVYGTFHFHALSLDIADPDVNISA